MDALMNALGYVGDALDKPGRAVRGVLAGKGREALAAVPFSDSLGITDHKQATSGRDLTDMYGITDKHDKSFGSSALGFGADMLTDPLNLLGGYAAFKAAPTVAKGLKAGAKSLSGLDLIDGLSGGAKRLLRGERGSIGLPSDLHAADLDEAGDLLAKRLGQQHGGSGSMYVPGKGSMQSADYIRPWIDFNRAPEHAASASDMAKAAEYYTGSGSGFDEINRYLRGGEVGRKPRVMDDLDKLWDVSRAPEEIPNLYRGVGGDAVRAIEAQIGVPLHSPEAIGRRFTDDGVLSTSLSKGHAKTFADGIYSNQSSLEPPEPGALLHFQGIRKGTTAVPIHPAESEVAFPPGRLITIRDNSQYPTIRADLLSMLMASLGGSYAAMNAGQFQGN